MNTYITLLQFHWWSKFDGQIIQESEKLDDMEDDAVKWDKARENAEITFQRDYLPKVFGTKYPPKAYVHLEGMNHRQFLT